MSADFETIVGLVADGLNGSGFALSRGNVQKWGARFTMERANIDGTVTLSFGPVLRESESSLLLPYLIVHERTFYGQIRVRAESTPKAIANRFLIRLSGIIENSLLPDGPSDPHVGVG